MFVCNDKIFNINWLFSFHIRSNFIELNNTIQFFYYQFITIISFLQHI